jgi:hypothetical protein
MEELDLKNMTGEKIRVIEGRMLNFGYKKVHVERTEKELNSLVYSSIVLAEGSLSEFPPLEYRFVDAFSGKTYYNSSIQDSDRKKIEYIKIKSFISFLEEKGFKTSEFYTIEELFHLYTHLTKFTRLTHSFYDTNGFIVKLFPTEYIKDSETGIIKPKLVYTKTFERLY